VAALYALTNLSIISVVPWREAMQSKFIVADFMRRTYGERSAQVVTALVMWTALASVFALTLSYSRIAYAAAIEGDFFRVFARLHPTGSFPHISLLTIGALSIAGAFFSLSDVISALLTSRILVQFIGQIAALHLLHKRGDIVLPFRMKLYPLPSVLALVGWVFVFSTSGWRFVALGVVTLAMGVVAYGVRQRVTRAAA
jgi:amino acid transporter